MTSFVFSFVILACLLSSFKAISFDSVPVICGDKCNNASSQYYCASFAGTFLGISPPNFTWFTAQLTNAVEMLGGGSNSSVGLTFTQQEIRIGGQTFRPPDVAMTITSGTDSSTSQSGNLITTKVGASCSPVFLSGLSVNSASTISASSWTWCGIFSSSIANIPSPQWSFSAAGYNSSFTTNFNNLGVRPATFCSPAVGSSYPGQPQNYLPYRIVGGTALPEGVDPVGSKSPVSTATPCFCPTTNVPTFAPTEAPSRAPTGAPTPAPSRAPTPAPSKAPTEEPTTAPTRAPTPPTEAPTFGPTRAPTPAPTKAPTEEPTAGPTRAPTPPTMAPTLAPSNEPTTAPTRGPTTAPTGGPTVQPTVAPTGAPTPPTLEPTNAPTPPTRYPTRAPTPPTIPPPTNVPTTGYPTAPIDICTRNWQAHFVLTYPSMTHGYVEGTVVYDWTKGVLAFYYTNQSYQEIYQYNAQLGVGNTNGQQVYKISPNGTCAPCSRYQNNWAFPIMWNVTGVQFLPTSTDANGCTNYSAPAGTNYWDTYFGMKADGTVCYFSNQGRLFSLSDIKPCATYDPALVTPPAGCTCNTPQDIVFSLDRSSSILTSSTYIYREFIQRFVSSYYFNPSSPSISTQMGIVQWGNVLNPTALPYPIGNFGSIPFTMDPANIQTAVSQIGCVGNPCNFCDANGNDTYCIFPTVYKTCTSCGLYGAGQLFLDATKYKKRAVSSQVIIVITDGNANTLNSSWSATGSRLCCGDGNPITSALVPGVDDDCIDGEWQTHAPLGCFTDINATRAQVQAMVPGVSIFAIGVGPFVNLPTLQVIASSPQGAFAAPNWETFLSQLQDIVTLTCVEPDPIASCGALACGFCACGNSQTPDGIIPPNMCEQIKIVTQGSCMVGVPIPLGCPELPCLTPGCDATLNSGMGGCIYTDKVCNQSNPCWLPYCINGSCIPRVICDPTNATCGCVTQAPVAPSAPTSAPTVAMECINTTGSPVALGCGFSGSCDHPTGTCVCVNGFHGILCQFPPGVDECHAVQDCQDSNVCTIDLCSNLTCSYTPVNCDDGDACTTDFCNASGCQNILSVSCEDGDGCTNDYCNSTDGLCYHVNRSSNCSYLTDTCNNAYCDPMAAADNQCFQQPIICPRDNNCTIAFCEMNATTNVFGCTNTTLDCAVVNLGLVAGLATGAIVGIVAAGLIAAATISGGAVVVATNSVSSNEETEVLSNPLYVGQNEENSNPLFSHLG